MEIDIALRYFERPVEERLKIWGVHFHKKPREELRTGTELMSVVEGYPGSIYYRTAGRGQAVTFRFF